MNGKNIVLGSWLGAVVMVVWRSFNNKTGAPAPSTLIKVNIAWSILAMLSDVSSDIAGALSVGLLIAASIANPASILPPVTVKTASITNPGTASKATSTLE
jgi:hypothetical protein